MSKIDKYTAQSHATLHVNSKVAWKCAMIGDLTVPLFRHPVLNGDLSIGVSVVRPNYRCSSLYLLEPWS